MKKGIYCGKGKMTNHCSVDFDETGVCFTGGSNGRVYIWKGRSLAKTMKIHGKGSIGALRAVDGKIISAGKDKKIIVTDPKTGDAEETLEITAYPRAIDMHDGNIIVGQKDGVITFFNTDREDSRIVDGHSTGETWGLDCSPDGTTVVTTGDDNQIIAWDIESKKTLHIGTISEEKEAAPIGRASTLSKMADS